MASASTILSEEMVTTIRCSSVQPLVVAQAKEKTLDVHHAALHRRCFACGDSDIAIDWHEACYGTENEEVGLEFTCSACGLRQWLDLSGEIDDDDDDDDNDDNLGPSGLAAAAAE